MDEGAQWRERVCVCVHTLTRVILKVIAHNKSALCGAWLQTKVVYSDNLCSSTVCPAAGVLLLSMLCHGGESYLLAKHFIASVHHLSVVIHVFIFVLILQIFFQLLLGREGSHVVSKALTRLVVCSLAHLLRAYAGIAPTWTVSYKECQFGCGIERRMNGYKRNESRWDKPVTHSSFIHIQISTSTTSSLSIMKRSFSNSLLFCTTCSRQLYSQYLGILHLIECRLFKSLVFGHIKLMVTSCS